MYENGLGLTAEYPATRTNFLVAGYAVRRNLLIQVEVVCNSEFKMAFFIFHFGYAVRSEK